MASGDTLCTFFANNHEPLDTAPATLDTRVGATNEQHLVLDFDASADESADFAGFMPRHYSGSTGVTVTIIWMATSATSGDCVWDVSFKRVQAETEDLDASTFAAANSVTDTANGTNGEVMYATVTFTDGADMDSVPAGEFFRLRITRNVDPSDSMTGDAELLCIEIKDT